MHHRYDDVAANEIHVVSSDAQTLRNTRATPLTNKVEHAKRISSSNHSSSVISLQRVSNLPRATGSSRVWSGLGSPPTTARPLSADNPPRHIAGLPDASCTSPIPSYGTSPGDPAPLSYTTVQLSPRGYITSLPITHADVFTWPIILMKGQRGLCDRPYQLERFVYDNVVCYNIEGIVSSEFV